MIATELSPEWPQPTDRVRPLPQLAVTRTVLKGPRWVGCGSADRDPSRWGAGADRFIVPRARNDGYLAFGTTRFSRVGKALAECAGERILTALAHRCNTLRLDGEPERYPMGPCGSWRSLPFQAAVHRGRVPRAVEVSAGRRSRQARGGAEAGTQAAESM